MGRRTAKPQPRHVTVAIRCPDSGRENVDVVDAPAKALAAAWLQAAERVDAAVCDCGRPHHARFSDEPPHTYPQPVTLRRPGGSGPALGVAL